MRRHRRPHGVVRLAGRIVVAFLGAVVFVLMSVQFGRIVSEDVAMAHSLSSVRRDVVRLRERKAEQERELRRLESPLGSIPAIHERLHLVRPGEAIVYVRPGTPAPR